MQLGIDLPVEEINHVVVPRLEACFRDRLPVLPGAVEAVRALHNRWPLGLASSSNREIIDLVLDLASLADRFVVTVSSEEVAHGNQRRMCTWRRLVSLASDLIGAVAIEDSSNGVRAAAPAAMAMIAAPSQHYPHDDDARGGW